MRVVGHMSEQRCTDPMVEQDNMQGESELELTQLAEAVLHHAEVSRSNVNHALVKDGWCWWYRKYAPGSTTLERLEVEAREMRIALWADPQPVLPWEWQKMK